MVSLNKNTFCGVRRLAPFCIETNPRENRFFAACGRLVGKNGTHSVKKRAENCTKQKCTPLFVGEVSGCEPLGQKRVLVEKRLMLCLSTEVKAPVVASLCTKWALPMR